MRIEFSHGEPLIVPCEGNGFEEYRRFCYWFAMVKGCSEDECNKWIGKDELCEIVCGGD